LLRCSLCGENSRTIVGEAEVEACSYQESFTPQRVEKNNTQHWEIGQVNGYCTKCSDAYVNNNVERNRANHSEGSAIDIGHSGIQHWFEYRCSKSGCGYVMRTVAVPCPGGENHTGLLKKPIQNITE